jgi:Fe-S-cluster containining protein
MGNEAWKRAEKPEIRCLSFHSEYRCQNSGVCCASGWQIAVEAQVEASLRLALAGARAPLPNGPEGFQVMIDPPPGCRSSLRDVGGTCWFRDESERSCAIHREFGEQSLPSACRQFPRVCVLEPDAVSISLSHYCPTAAGLLFGTDADFKIVTQPKAFPAAWPFEGLDARHSYPPFLRPGVSLGFDGLRTFEERTVRTLSTLPLWRALSVIDSAVGGLRAWNADAGPLPALISGTFDRAAEESEIVAPGTDPRPILQAALAEGTVAMRLPNPRPTPMSLPPVADLALRKYVASRLIGAWVMFQADDIRTVLNYLRLCVDTVLLFANAAEDRAFPAERWKEAIRNSDLWLLHYCDPERLALHLR